MLDLARWDWSRHWPYLAGALVVLASIVLIERARRRAIAERARVAALPEEARKALESDRSATRDRRGRRVEDLLTAAVAAAAAGLSAAQLGKFGRDVMGLHGPWAYLPFVALDFAAVVCALRARRRASRGAAAGLSGALVWVLALLSASMSASEGDNLGEAFALGIWAPIAAVLWELGLAEERHARTERADRRIGLIRWLHPIERVLVLAELAGDEHLGAADATERVRERRAARALYRLRQATEARAALVDGGVSRPKRGTERRYRRAEAFAQRTAARVRLADAEVEAAVLPQLRILVDVGRLANMTWPAPDATAIPRQRGGRPHLGTGPTHPQAGEAHPYPTATRRVAGVAVSAGAGAQPEAGFSSMDGGSSGDEPLQRATTAASPGANGSGRGAAAASSSSAVGGDAEMEQQGTRIGWSGTGDLLVGGTVGSAHAGDPRDGVVATWPGGGESGRGAGARLPRASGPATLGAGGAATRGTPNGPRGPEGRSREAAMASAGAGGSTRSPGTGGGAPRAAEPRRAEAGDGDSDDRDRTRGVSGDSPSGHGPRYERPPGPAAAQPDFGAGREGAAESAPAAVSWAPEMATPPDGEGLPPGARIGPPAPGAGHRESGAMAGPRGGEPHLSAVVGAYEPGSGPEPADDGRHLAGTNAYGDAYAPHEAQVGSSGGEGVYGDELGTWPESASTRRHVAEAEVSGDTAAPRGTVAGARRHVADADADVSGAVVGADTMAGPESFGGGGRRHHMAGAWSEDLEPDRVSGVAGTRPVASRRDAGGESSGSGASSGSGSVLGPGPGVGGGRGFDAVASEGRLPDAGVRAEVDGRSWEVGDLHHRATAEVRWEGTPQPAPSGMSPAAPNRYEVGAAGSPAMAGSSPDAGAGSPDVPGRRPRDAAGAVSASGAVRPDMAASGSGTGATPVPARATRHGRATRHDSDPDTAAPGDPTSAVAAPRGRTGDMAPIADSGSGAHRPPSEPTLPDMPATPADRRAEPDVTPSRRSSPAESAAGDANSAPAPATPDTPSEPPARDPIESSSAASIDYDIALQGRVADGAALTTAARRDPRVLSLAALLAAEADLTGAAVGRSLGVSERTGQRLLRLAQDELDARRNHADNPDLADAGL
ncbi:hypothetical protein ACIBSV_02320 [Embleya sp. NPDC050154]|uniref:hypothetical protein n=1 Tax=Embleya sp. NPDC050154 TaxID=3363988 RepID=UPI0037B3DF3B